jgi:hypothetical protein
MSLASSPDSQIRPEDKAFGTFFPPDEPPTNFFDEYLNENYDFSDGDNKETLDDFLDSFETTSRGIGCLSPIVGSTREEASPPQPWRKGLWCLNQNRASLSGHVYDKGRGAHVTNGNTWSSRAEAIGKARSKTFTNFSRPVPRSPPYTPSYEGSKRVPPTSPRTARKVRNVPQTFSREGTLSPKSSYARNQGNSKMAYQELLQCHLQNIHLLVGDEAETLSPSAPGKPIQSEYSARGNSANVARNGATASSHAVASPIDDINGPYPSVENGNGAFDPSLGSSWQSNNLSTALSPQEQELSSAGYLSDSHDGVDAVWTARTLNPPIGSQYAYNSQAEYKYLGELQNCWSQTTSTSQPDAPHPYKELYPTIVAPIPHRPAHQLLQDPVSPQGAGLGILCSEIDSSLAGRIYPTLLPLEPPCSYPPLPEIAPEPVHTFTDTSPLTTPRHNQHPTDLHPSCSASPSISPTNTKYNYAATSRSLRQISPTRQCANRRKSIGAPNASSFTNSHHHNSAPPSKQTRPSRTPKTPTGAGGSGVIDFVNFTPKDSVKLLSDVAPSGSSKTRARREQEARDKRRRLSEAAVRAVRRAAKAAGGDVGDGEVEALERAILA